MFGELLNISYICTKNKVIMKKTVLVIGNGFDIDLGLPTSFSDFAKSKEWKDLTEKLDTSFWKKEKHNSLLGELLNASRTSNWFDIEEELYKYTCINHSFSQEAITIVQSEFSRLKNALKEYLIPINSSFPVEEKSIAKTLLFELCENNSSVEIINFNYTNPINLIGQSIDSKGNHMTYVHGSLDEDIVLGCDTKTSQINEQLSYLYKYNMLKKANHMVQNMIEAEDVFIFGHSINKMDFGYFYDYLKIASSSIKPKRNLTIFTKDYNSEISIKNNIKSQGISVTDLYNHLWSFDFIHTQGIYNNTQEDCDKWSNLLRNIRQ